MFLQQRAAREAAGLADGLPALRDGLVRVGRHHRLPVDARSRAGARRGLRLARDDRRGSQDDPRAHGARRQPRASGRSTRSPTCSTARAATRTGSRPRRCERRVLDRFGVSGSHLFDRRLVGLGRPSCRAAPSAAGSDACPRGAARSIDGRRRRPARTPPSPRRQRRAPDVCRRRTAQRAASSGPNFGTGAERLGSSVSPACVSEREPLAREARSDSQPFTVGRLARRGRMPAGGKVTSCWYALALVRPSRRGSPAARVAARRAGGSSVASRW